MDPKSIIPPYDSSNKSNLQVTIFRFDEANSLKYYITMAEAADIEKYITEELFIAINDFGEVARFNCWEFKADILQIECEDNSSVMWLRTAISCKYPDVHVVQKDKLLNLKEVSFSIEADKSATLVNTMKFIGGQNKELKVYDWFIIKTEDSWLYLGISDDDLEKIAMMGGKIRLGPKKIIVYDGKTSKPIQKLKSAEKRDLDVTIVRTDKHGIRYYIEEDDSLEIKTTLKKELFKTLGDFGEGAIFNSWDFSDDMLRIECGDDLSLKWLKKTLTAKYTNMNVLRIDQLNNLKQVYLILTDIKEETLGNIMKILAGQNKGLKVPIWFIIKWDLNLEVEGEITIHFNIPDEDYKIISLSRNGMIRFGLEKIAVFNTKTDKMAS